MKIGDKFIWVLPSGEYQVKVTGGAIGPGGAGYTFGFPGGGPDVNRLRYDGPYYPIEITEGDHAGQKFMADARELKIIRPGQ